MPSPPNPSPVEQFDLFASPVAVTQVPHADELNRELAARLLDESQRVPSLQRSNVGGWHSRPDLTLRPDACYQALVQEIINNAWQMSAALAGRAGLSPTLSYRFGAIAWAMVMRTGDYTIAHNHGDAHWSSAYYVDAGDADEARYPESGLLAFTSPYHAGRPIPGLDLFPSTFTVRPRTGALVLFPGYLQHYVHAYRGVRPRIAVSCNIAFVEGT